MSHPNYVEPVPLTARHILHGPPLSAATLQRLTSSATATTKDQTNNNNNNTATPQKPCRNNRMQSEMRRGSVTGKGQYHSLMPNQQAHTVSQGTGHRFFSHHIQENEPEVLSTDSPVPQPPKRSSSLLGATFLRHKRDVSVTLNPKRVSVATSTFWDGHPDMAHLVNTIGWEHINKQRRGTEERPKSALWGTNDRGTMMDSWGWGDPPAVKKGILFQQREKLLARWKERYCILTRDYLHCFRRTTSIHRSGVRLSEMGSFIFKTRLADIEDIQLETRRVGTVIAIALPHEPKILFRVIGDNQEALRQWFTLLQECLYMSKERRQALRTMHTGTGTTVTTNMTSRSSVSNSDGSPTSSSSNSDNEKDTLRRNLANLKLNETEHYDTVEEDDTSDEKDLSLPEEKVVLRRDRDSGKTSLMDFMAQNGNGTVSRSSMTPGSVYAVPESGTASRKRPESWNPQPITYRTPTLVPSQWLSGKRDTSARLMMTAGAPTFSRASQLYSTSRHTSEITFRKMT